ncbi:MAG TPA: penicillin acylase family protein, partial [Flavisolibacter sp.]
MKKLLLLLLFPVTCFSQEFTKAEIERFHKQASAVTIIEDTWGVPHIYGRTDADAVFGMMYVQCLQNFRQVERNYLEVFGRLAEADGDHMIWQDIQMQMIYDTAAAKRDYAASPAWLKKLLHAFADGVNFYLYKHPSVKPVVLKRFEPWFPLMYTDGSIS